MRRRRLKSSVRFLLNAMEEQIKEFAQTFISKCSERLGVNLEYNQASVEWLSGYIERVRLNLDEPSVDGLTNWIGSFLGECIIANYGGECREWEGTGGISFPMKMIRMLRSRST